MEFRILGPVELVGTDGPVALGGRQRQLLLAVLLSRPGDVCSADMLADALWGDEPPASATTVLHAQVYRLRKLLEPERPARVPASVLRSVGDGYLVDLDGHNLDAARFARLVDQGRAAVTTDPAVAKAQFGEALALWRGAPFGDLADHRALEAAATELEENRLGVTEELAEVRLRLGEHAELVAELDRLVGTHPFRERLWGHLMLALYRCGRQADALATVRRVRALLAEEIGVDPGPELQDLERRVLAHDPHLDLPVDLSAPAAAPPQRVMGGRFVRRPLTSFLGREEELRMTTERLAERRLVSLVGPAGVGKTRVAVEYAAARPALESTWLARLAHVREPAELPNVVADAIGLVTVRGDPTGAVISTVADRPGLLILDNCEHVVDAAAGLVIALTEECPRLRILATSREPLGIDGEITIPVRPLPLAADDGADGAAVALLMDRVQSVRPGWMPSNEDLTQARRISAALDGLPLAIELAAARARVLGLAEIAARLDDRFAVLGSVPRGSLTTHATLDAAIGWSIELLSDVDRDLLLRLWPFEGGFTLESAEAVRPAPDPSRGGETLESLSSLVTRSVVVADTTFTPTRYLLLESIRAYCRTVDPDQPATREAHARWVRELAAGCVVAVRGTRGGWYLRMLGREMPNIRAGIAHDLEHNPFAASHSAGQLGLFFTRGVHHAEALRLVRAVISAAPDAPATDRARTMIILIALTYFAGEVDEARHLLTPTLEVYAEFSDDEDTFDHAELRHHLAFSAAQVGNVDVALAAADQAIALGRDHDFGWIVGAARTVRAVALVLQAHLADDEAAVVDSARAAQLFTRGWIGAWSHVVLAEAHLRHRDESMDERGQAVAALAALRLALNLFRQEEDVPFVLGVLYLGALALARTGHPVDGVRLLAAVHHHADQLAVRAPTILDPNTAWVEDAMTDVLDSPRRAAAVADGAGLTLPGMVALLADPREV